MRLSVLEQSVICKGETPYQALQKTVELAKLADELGYTRFWVAEHHNTNGIAGTSPEILISHLASQTSRIRLGSGGVLLPQYSPYKIAENFKLLETLFPNRIDLGLGRSPGGSTATRLALTDGIRKSLNEFPRQVENVQRFFKNEFPEDHVYHQVHAYPDVETAPEMWILGVSHRGARVAAEYGTAFTYGHFITPEDGIRAINDYREQFRPSSYMKKPKVNVCVFVVCAPTQKQAEEWVLSQDMWLLEVEQGGDTRIPSVEEAKQKGLTNEQLKRVKSNRNPMIIGSPEKVRENLLQLSEKYETEEMMIINNVYDFNHKLQTYRLLADMFL